MSISPPSLLGPLFLPAVSSWSGDRTPMQRLTEDHQTQEYKGQEQKDWPEGPDAGMREQIHRRQTGSSICHAPCVRGLEAQPSGSRGPTGVMHGAFRGKLFT